MTIYLGNRTAPDNAPAGTVIGTLSAKQGNTEVPCIFTIINNPHNYFAISANNLVTAQNGGMAAGQYSVQVRATPVPLSALTTITITVTDPPPASPQPPPLPTAITLTPANSTVADDAPAGSLLATAAVSMSDGSQFTGTLTTSDTNFFAISGLSIVTARALTSADDGTHTTVITASQGSQSLSVRFSV